MQVIGDQPKLHRPRLPKTNCWVCTVHVCFRASHEDMDLEPGR